MKIRDFKKDFSDGVMIANLLELVTGIRVSFSGLTQR